MALTSFSPTDLQYSIPEIWGPKVKNIFEARLVAGKFFDDWSSELSAGGDTVNIPDLTSNALSAQNKSTGDEVSVQSPAQGTVQLSVDTWKEVSFVIERKEELQMLRSYKMQSKYMKNAAYRLAEAYDTSILSLYSGLSQTEGDASSNLREWNIRSAMATLAGNNVPLEECALIVHPSVFYEDLLGDSKFVDASQFGMSAPMATGKIPTILGVPVIITSQVVASGGGYYNLLAHPDAFAHATQGGGVNVDADKYLKQIGTLFVNDILYGVKEERDDAAVALIANSSSSIVS